MITLKTFPDDGKNRTSSITLLTITTKTKKSDKPETAVIKKKRRKPRTDPTKR
ncbi:MAG: hypothetical protein UR85_C0003G0096 [Candidatus Nomurabacteria bacterium GW2011_GWF2_35_66]|uniref:Uncharacterized protein n=1 Tax=Candidatus Nomurabacteria bacterium GW2011_GWE1_35_16 TaxID=1618761 RepID=A0A0G0B8D9_9BACT|nr:MAG: hypothetical protein UR55_C0005G0095 [Candidatus Nomurabacteria bacterium GW2011_GWF1_34_20]KKP63423.1 MAG: hypothetical protein UR57_C0005G0095 [Candidatus Nomurabacteria bacterium GW2011_GWE2_34_25]KKP65609.1 MAG: hypothetical protein UR64_C0023G0004 [Candidatus Nomurabacteria bacterium GW2011_GWE1_35_16]KKP83661.1 MAG: hypothetical protein UR85_C0003G0096 [Candidatus Nomurabacteria bacterium GW2011_GWF2_35_66]